jgi:ABC-2 type transport system ATP-binding protein
MWVATDLCKDYAGVVAVDRISIRLGAGQIVGLASNNGAGKTTTLKMLCGFLEPSSGQVLLHGKDPLEAPVRANLGFLPEDSPLYEDMAPLGYLGYFGALGIDDVPGR